MLLYFNVLLETVNGFVYIYKFFDIKMAASFIKTRFYWRKDCISMLNYAETLQCNDSYNVIYKVFILWNTGFCDVIWNVNKTKARLFQSHALNQKVIRITWFFMWHNHYAKCVQIRSFFWSTFFRMCENTDQKKFRNVFLRLIVFHVQNIFYMLNAFDRLNVFLLVEWFY